MSYLIIGDTSIITKEINELKEKYKIDSNSISRYDLLTDSILDAIYDINTFNMFSTKKLVICDNIDSILESDELVRYLKNQNDNILVLTALKVDNKKKIVKEIKEYSTVIDASSVNLFDFIKDSFKGYKISSITINLLKDYCNNDYLRLTNEIDKLKMYKDSSKEILDCDVSKLVKKSLTANVFDLTSAINKKNHKKMFDIYYELLKNGEDEIKLISILANNFRVLFKIKTYLYSYGDEEIISMLKMHPYRYKMLKQDLVNYSSDDLIKYIKLLSDMDIRIKKGEVDKKNAMELFFTRI